MAQTALNRRQLLMAGAALPVVVTAACSAKSNDDPDTLIRSTVATSEAALIALYDATIAAQPELADKLTPLRDQHREHLSSMATDSTSNPSASASPSVSSSKSAATVALADAERVASKQRAAASLQAADPNLVWTLSLIAASESQHVMALGRTS